MSDDRGKLLANTSRDQQLPTVHERSRSMLPIAELNSSQNLNPCDPLIMVSRYVTVGGLAVSWLMPAIGLVD